MPSDRPPSREDTYRILLFDATDEQLSISGPYMSLDEAELMRNELALVWTHAVVVRIPGSEVTE